MACLQDEYHKDINSNILKQTSPPVANKNNLPEVPTLFSFVHSPETAPVMTAQVEQLLPMNFPTYKTGLMRYGACIPGINEISILAKNKR
jgi:hypothetical protein